MTSVAVWVAVDSRAPSSLYIASDSRIRWPGGHTWDQGRKVFASSLKPCIFGYWGDVLFPALAIPVIIDRIDGGLLDLEAARWYSPVETAIRLLWKEYPEKERGSFGIAYGFRVGVGLQCEFKRAITAYASSSKSWKTDEIPMPPCSAILAVKGSGSSQVRKSYGLWQASSEANTSRAAFSAFCESIAGGGDPASGGAPQLAGLYRKDPGKLFGIIHEGLRHFAGSALSGNEDSGDVEWRDHLFQLVDGPSKSRLPDAQRHRPRELGKV